MSGADRALTSSVDGEQLRHVDAEAVLDRLLHLAESLPQRGGTVTFDRGGLLELAGVPVLDTDRPGPPGQEREAEASLTVQQIADEYGRKPSTVRGWMASIPEAFKALGREWRCPREAVERFLQGEHAAGSGEGADAAGSPTEVDLSAWRRVGGNGDT